jgi:hypothetical protein
MHERTHPDPFLLCADLWRVTARYTSLFRRRPRALYFCFFFFAQRFRLILSFHDQHFDFFVLAFSFSKMELKLQS